MVNNLVGGIIPPQPPIEAQTEAHVLKTRLEWGEPAFTILDVRDRPTYNEGHILGAMPMPADELVQRAVPSLDKSRDIYVYGANEEETAQAVQQLRSNGFQHVSQLKGGLDAWKAIGGPTEGIAESKTPAGADDYNVVDRLKNHQENLQKGGTSATGAVKQGASNLKEGASNLKENIQEGASNLKENIQEGASNLKENIQEEASNLKEGIQEGASNVKEGIQEGASNVKEGIQEGASNVKESANRNPDDSNVGS